MANKKKCKRCKKPKGLKSFPRSARAKDGHLNYCSECWSIKMTAASKRRYAASSSAEVPEPELKAKKRKKSDNALDFFNTALDAANGSKEIWEVVAEDGDRKEFRGQEAKKRAFKQSLRWMMDGYPCKLREIHEYKPNLRLEILD